MFDLFRSQKKVVKFFLTFLLSLVALSMAITLIPGLFSGQTAPDPNGQVLVQVGDDAVTAVDVAVAMREYARAGTPADSMAFMARQVIDNLVGEKVLLQEADRLGLKPSDQELANWLRDQMPFLWQGGSFNSVQYQQIVTQRFEQSIPQFEQNVLKDLTIETRLRQIVTDSVIITDDELQDLYADRNETAKIDYVVVDPAKFAGQVEVNDEKIQAYFESARFRYRVPEQRTVKLLAVDQSSIPSVEFTDGQVANFYNQNRYRFETPERVLTRHILFMTIDPETGTELSEELQTEKETKANEALAKLNEGADFAELATEVSEDAGTQAEGGLLPWAVRGQFDEDFEKAAFSIEPGQKSGVVKSALGYHIIQVEKKDPPQTRSLDDAREEILADLAVEREQTARLEQVDRVLEAVRSAGNDVDQAAAGLGIPVQTYGPFGARDMPADISKFPTFAGNLMSAPVADPVTHEQDGVTFVGVVSEITPARDSELAEVRDQVIRDYVDAESRTLARAQADEVLAAATQADLASAARRFGLSVQSSGYFKRTGGVEGFATGQVLGDQPFDAAPGSVFGPVSGQSGVGVYTVTDQAEADMTNFSQERGQLKDQVLKSRQDEAFNIYRSLAQREWQDSGRIRRFDDRIEQYIRSFRRI